VSPTGDAGCFADFPTLGIDQSALYVGANMFCGPNPNQLQFFNSSAFVVRKSDVLTGAGGDLRLRPGAVRAFRRLISTVTFQGIVSPFGVDNFDPDATRGYFIGQDNFFFGVLVLREVLNPGSGAPSLAPEKRITVPATSFPINVPTPGGGAPLNSLDGRIMGAHIRNGRLFATHHIGVDEGGVAVDPAGRNGVRWYEIDGLDTAGPAPVQVGTVYDPSIADPLSYWMGTLMTSGQGHMALAFSAANPFTRAGAATLGRLASDPPGTTRGTPVFYHPGQADYRGPLSAATAPRAGATTR
jgi:hypothetical protein